MLQYGMWKLLAYVYVSVWIAEALDRKRPVAFTRNTPLTSEKQFRKVGERTKLQENVHETFKLRILSRYALGSHAFAGAS
jgi:hypothetical protein